MEGNLQQDAAVLAEGGGGTGEPLTAAEKETIREGMKNHPANTKPYNFEKMLECGEKFMQNHPVEWLSGR